MTDWLDLLDNTANQATPGPWTYRFSPGTAKTPSGWHLVSEAIDCLGDLGDADSAKLDAAFIARFDPDTVKLMLQVVRAAVKAPEYDIDLDYPADYDENGPFWVITVSAADVRNMIDASETLDALAEHVRKGQT